VAALVGFAQVGDVEAGVAVEGLEAAVPEELLDVVEIGVALDHLGGAAPAEGVRGDVDVQPELTAVAAYAIAQGMLRERPAGLVDEDGGAIAVAETMASERERPYAPDVGGEPFAGGLADGNVAFFPPLPHDAGNAAFDVEIRDREAFELADPDAARVQQFEGGAVADTGRRGGVDLAHELLDLGMAEDACGQQVGYLDIVQVAGQWTAGQAVLVQQVEQRAYAFDDGVDRAGFHGQALAGEPGAQIRLEAVQMGRGDGLGRTDPAGLCKVCQEDFQRGRHYTDISVCREILPFYQPIPCLPWRAILCA
jgi:hypothetical protein